MSAETLIKVEGVSKKFCRNLKKSLWYGMKDLGSEILSRPHGGKGELRPDEFWAVKDVSFELKRGECLGLIGRNGAGKTTLLRMLNGLIKPDCGRIEMRGRVGALIALGAGFNPILTGRENIYVNASVLGLTKSYVDSKLEEIIEFAEMGEFIDMPVQSYSSGMSVRLGFSIAAILIEPDILFLDEVLAVGDMAFTLKCFNRIDRILPDSAVIFVSHNMPQVSRIATQAIMLERGYIAFASRNVSECLDAYYSKLDIVKSFFSGTGAKLKELKFNGLDALNLEKSASVNRLSNIDLSITFDLGSRLPREPGLYLVVYDAAQRGVAEYVQDPGIPPTICGNSVTFLLRLPKIQFSKGIYSLTVALLDENPHEVLLRVQSTMYFQVLSDKNVWTAVQLLAEPLSRG